jgi:uncharacterized protein (UPF0335 family)
MATKPKPTRGVGHNSIDKDRLRAFVDRIESLSEKAELASDIRDVYAEAKGAGYDVAALRQVIKMRRQDAGERDARQAIIDEYMASSATTARHRSGPPRSSAPALCRQCEEDREMGILMCSKYLSQSTTR